MQNALERVSSPGQWTGAKIGKRASWGFWVRSRGMRRISADYAFIPLFPRFGSPRRARRGNARLARPSRAPRGGLTDPWRAGYPQCKQNGALRPA